MLPVALEVVAFGLVDVEVLALGPPLLVLATFGPLLHEPITFSKFLVRLVTLDPLELGLANLGLYIYVELVAFVLPILELEALSGVVFS